LAPENLTHSIVFCTTNRNRTVHLRQTLPRNMADNPKSRFLVVNYSSEDDFLQWIFAEMADEIRSGRLTVYSVLGRNKFDMSHAKNTAARCGMLERADILVTLDADNFAGSGFEDFIAEKFKEPNVFLCPKVIADGTGNVRIAPRGVAGRLAVRAQDFLKAGGYDEFFKTWRGEDVDLVARLKRMGYAPRYIDPRFLDAIRHGDDLRFKDYPEAKAFENDEEIKRINNEKHTIVNFGKIGCGVVHKNQRGGPIDLRPLGTRVFGIGFQRTATTSLHQAFELLGFDSFHWNRGHLAREIWEQMEAYGKSWQLERWYALSDNPIPLLYKQLDEAYPGSKFILTVRDDASWLRSVERLWDPKHNPNRWEWDKWPISNRIHRAIYGRTDFDGPTFLERYRRHNREVVEYFKGRDDLLMMNGGSGWDRLCRFLDVPIPDAPYPHANQSVT